MNLKANAITVEYDNRIILENLDFQIEAGVFSCLLGPNGVGKSTLIKALAGVLGIAKGQIFVDETPLRNLSPKNKARQIGYLPQEVQPSFSMTVLESVELGARAANRANGAKKALQQAKAFNLSNRRLDELSGGERRRVLLAGILAQQPQFLLLDEPASMLDIGHQAEVFSLLKNLTQQGMGILCITHDLNLAACFAETLHVITSQNTIMSGPPSEILCNDLIEKTFGAKFKVIKTSNGTPAILPISPDAKTILHNKP